ncbi:MULTISPECIES: YxeA family protein [Staphylococcus]|uniref:YxeA family protein n=1 Tax=Staphylococcus sp. Marseille-Q1834 TaxID=2866594 RepID=UPI001CF89275
MRILKTLRNILIAVVIIAIIAVGGLFGLNAYSDKHPNNRSVNDWNKLNPLAPTYAYYVKTQKPSKVETLDKEKDFYLYHYNQKGYTKDGKSKKIEYTAPKKLKTDHYLVVKEKSHTITSYEEVKKSDIPNKAKEKL